MIHRTPLLPLLGLVVVLLAALAAIVLARSEARTNARAERSVRTQFAIGRLRGNIAEYEASYRGYMVRKLPALLDDMARARQGIEGDIGAVRAGIAGHPGQIARFDRLVPLIRERVRLGDLYIDGTRQGRLAELLAQLRPGAGRQISVQIARYANAMRAEEERQLAARRAEAERLLLLLSAGLVGAVVLVVAVGLLVWRDARGRMRVLAAINAEAVAARNAVQDEMRLREEAEQQVRHMQRLESIGQLTGGIAHDFNNMLAVIVGGLDMARRRLERDERERALQSIGSAQAGAQRAASLVARLLAFARRQPLAPRVLDVNRLVAGMSDLLHRSLGERVAVETVLAAGLWRVHADAGQLENAILNLAVNARDAMEELGGGDSRLTIETGNAWLDEAYAAQHAELVAGQFVAISVTDTGSGMDAETVARAFEPFFTTKEVGRGTGLGLSQVFGFIKQSAGHVAIYSEPGRGTTVKLYLPRHHGEEVAEPEQVPELAPAPRPDICVLVVEDESRVRAFSTEALEELGYRTVAAADAEEALAILRADKGIALLFTDVVMPGMDGRRLAEAALAIRPGLPILFTTGYTRNAVTHNGVLDAGVTFLTKPFTVAQLAARLRDVLEPGSVT